MISISGTLEVLNAMILRAKVFVMTTPVLAKAFTIVSGLIALFNLYVLATDPEAVDMFIAFNGGDLTMASGIIAMDLMAVRNMAATFRGMMTSAPAAASAA